MDDLFSTPPANAPAEANPAPAPAPAENADPFSQVQPPQPEQLATRHWVDNTGNFEVDARLIEILDGKVRLLKDNGATCTVALRRLSAADADYVQQISATYGPGLVGQQLASR